MQTLPQKYEPKNFEEKIYSLWEKANVFKVAIDDRKPYTILMPPPNVTGVLHMGHALQDTVQDMFIRYKRMQNFNVFWIPGKDHAGIATQNVVEKILSKEGIKKETLGREKFIARVWEFVEQHKNHISKQKRKLGDSCDWSKEKFTLDSGPSEAVMKAFIQFYNKKLIYKGNYIINWCSRCHTALSNEEVENIDEKSHLWYISYPIHNESDEAIVVATTRPETMFGDTAVAVNPKDNRYKKYLGKYVKLPLTDKLIPIIGDDYVDMNFATGAVKITPSHDPNDFEMGKRQKLQSLQVIDLKGKMNENTPQKYQNMDRFECRKQVIADLEQLHLLVKTESHTHSIGICSRCETIVEPIVSDQWFVKMKPLAYEAIKVMKEKKIAIFPQRWEKIYINWLENIRDWCISRQLWWGHRIPVYYCEKCHEQIAAKENPGKCNKCGSSKLYQDEDVLDTWFSSWLWPLSTLGWPNKGKEFEYYYPTDLLVSGYDILFFWIIRMVVAGMIFEKQIPFKNIYLTGIVKDNLGRRMSKSLGNGIDPIDIINQYGTDALRFTMIYLCTDGQDINLDPIKFEMGNHFANKIWNAFRFMYGHLEKISNIGSFYDKAFEFANNNNDTGVFDKWILGCLHKTIEKVSNNYAEYKLQFIAFDLYQFIRHDFCDWYLELSKLVLFSNDQKAKEKKLMILLYTFTAILKILHPLMPFITEELYSFISTDNKFLASSDYPEINKSLMMYDDITVEMMKEIVVGIRNIKAELNVHNRKDLTFYIHGNDEINEIIIKYGKEIIDIAKIKELKIVNKDLEEQCAVKIVLRSKIFLPLHGIVDITKEIERITKEIDQAEKKLDFVTQKLSKQDFITKAKSEAIESAKNEKIELDHKIKELKEKRLLLK